MKESTSTLSHMNNEETLGAHSSLAEEGSARKKAKVADAKDLATTAFGLYRGYVDSLDDDDDSDHDDENSGIVHLVKLLESSDLIKPFQEPLSSISNSTDLLGILASVVHYQMASTAIEQHLNDDTKSLSTLKQAQDFVDKSLFYFPRNAACRSMGANFGRITETMRKETVIQWYQQAAKDARFIRNETLELLENMEYVDDTVKEWMELLLLQQVVGVEYLMQNDEDELLEHEPADTDNDDGYFSASSVEGTSRFMAAMLLSRDGHHEDALHHLKSFSSLTHRLHPNVWTGQGSATCSETDSTRAATSSRIPVSFQNVLPTGLYQQMCNVFGPNAAFWRESDYANQGYYSFLAKIGSKPKNLIDEVVMNHLLPLAKQVLGNQSDEICAYEWWAHSRQASLGHMLHFDTDEANLEPGQTVHHPVLSSVLHLTGDESSGATIVLDQTPDSGLAQMCWRSVPSPNTFMVFPGNLLHGVLPCPGTATVSTTQNTPSVTTANTWIEAPPPSSPSQRRLTFMVGFKTRQVPDQRQGQKMYGPCAPLPPDTEEWVKEIQHGYNNEEICNSGEPRQEGPCMKELPSVSPAWERIPNGSDTVDPPLQLPRGIDQRFFVSGAPECFRRTLFQKDDDD